MGITPNYGLRQLDALNDRDSLRGVSDQDIVLAQATGMWAEDIEALRMVAYNYHLLLIFRCPKQNTRHSIEKNVPPKPYMKKEWAAHEAKPKSDEDGLSVDGSWASDYDLMGMFEFARGGPGQVYARIRTSLPTVMKANRSPLTPEATTIYRIINRQVRHRLQHGANDDWQTLGPKPLPHCDVQTVMGAGKRYVAFTETSSVRLIPTFGHLDKFYKDNGLDWPYASLQMTPQAP